jgi:hypothetical protein
MRTIIWILSLVSTLALGANQNLSNRIQVGTANIVVPGTSAGLVAAAGLPGNSTGSTAGSGYVGELIQSTGNGTGGSNGTSTQQASITLSAGSWDVTSTVVIGSASGITAAVFCINTISASESGCTVGYDLTYVSVPGTTSNASGSIGPIRKTISTSTTYYLNIRTVGAGSVSEYWNLRATRVD